jgi:CheY-like chemotaxis protein
MANVLVVEDEPNVRKLVSVNLVRRGYTLHEARDGREALAQLRDRQPDLVMLDIKLPDLTGWEVLDRIAADPDLELGCNVLVMTASIMDAHVDHTKYPAVVGVLVKPFSTVELLAAVTRALKAK